MTPGDFSEERRWSRPYLEGYLAALMSMNEALRRAYIVVPSARHCDAMTVMGLEARLEAELSE